MKKRGLSNQYGEPVEPFSVRIVGLVPVTVLDGFLLNVINLL